MNGDVLAALPLGNAIFPLLIEAQAKNRREARRGIRYPFFHPASFTTDTGSRYNVFCRDISASGVGLLHRLELPLGEAELCTATEQGISINVRVRTVRCRPCGEGWYLSGARYVSHTLHDLERLRQELRPLLCEAREVDASDDPSRMRYPCFRSVSIILNGGIRYPAFTRDISTNGIGLLHEMELPLSEVEINIASGRGYQVRVCAQIMHCRPCGQKWYLSGGRFTSIPAVL